MPQLRPSGSSFAAFSAAKVQKVCELRAVFALKVRKGGLKWISHWDRYLGMMTAMTQVPLLPLHQIIDNVLNVRC